MAEQFSKFTAVFAPKRRDDLHADAVPYIGRVFTWQRAWIIEDGPYAGQWACMPVNYPERVAFGWAPECDLTTAVKSNERVE